MANRTYRYQKEEALYPFGYGLSYTKFEYSRLELSSESIKAGQTLEVTVLVKNTRKTEGIETVQLYIRDNEASVTVPKWSLCGIRKLNISPGEEKEACFSVTPMQMAVIFCNISCSNYSHCSVCKYTGRYDRY
jgi:beta-glucosidase